MVSLYIKILFVQLHDWVQVNKRLLLDSYREEDMERKGIMASDTFTSVLKTLGSPLEEADFQKLLSTYDKKGEGKINYEDFISEQKYVNAVSIIIIMHSRTIIL